MTSDKRKQALTSRRSFFRIAGSTAIAASLAGCTGGNQSESSTESESDSEEETELTIGFGSELTNLDPHFTSGAAAWTVNYNILETLITFEDGELSSRLATDWAVSDDGTEYTFSLKQGVMFHPPVSREMVAEDVVYSFNRMNQEGSLATSLSAVETVEATDEYEVTFTLSEAFAPLLTFFARVKWVIIPEEAVQEQGTEPSDFQEPVGTGPFVFDTYESGNFLQLTAFDEYHADGVPQVDAVRVQPIPDQDSRVAALQAGDIDMAQDIPGRNAGQIDSASETRIEQQPATTWAQIHINCEKEPWDDPAVRRAVAHAIDRSAIVEAGAGGYGTAAWQAYPEGSRWHFDLDESQRRQSASQAQQILADAGNPLEDHTLQIKTNTSFPIMETTADLVTAGLNQAGISAETNVTEWGTQLDDFLNSNFGAMAFSVPFKIDPDRHYFDFIHPDGSQFNNYGPDQPDAQQMYDLVKRGRTESNINDRVEAYTELEQLVNKNLPWISVARTDDLIGFQSTVEGYDPWLLPYSRWWELNKE